MGRTVAVIWHASFSIAAGVLYFFFVLPRWPELSGDTPHTLGTVLRVVVGVLVALAALPVVFTLLRTRRPEYGTPQLALTMRIWSIVLHVLGGVLIVGTAISEIWLSLDSAGLWLFGIYGAAAAISLLGIAAFYLSFVAELPPPPPRPLKAKDRKRRRGGKDAEPDEEADDEKDDHAAAEEKDAEKVEEEREDVPPDDGEQADGAEKAPEPEAQPAEVTAEDDTPAAEEDPPAADDTVASEPARGGLRNRRPAKTGTSRWRRRMRGGVPVED
ncbi:MAG: hypothetical protein JWR32_5669 [Mycobacterium sp.]|jgi:hypothetical protein|nr:hypothetical protein [Mycobacterium sp.]